MAIIKSTFSQACCNDLEAGAVLPDSGLPSVYDALQTQINDETTARTLADTSLSTQISNITTLGTANYFPDVAWEINAGYTDNEIVNRKYPAGHVQRYGADISGLEDSAVAFNLATRSDYTGTGILVIDQFAGTVIVPAGYFRINSAVWVHKGQHLKGEGEGGTNILLDQALNYGGAIFRLGQSSEQSEFPTGSGLTVDTADAGGLPPEISGLWTYGGPVGYPVITTRAAGASIHNIFLTSCGVGIQVEGGDVRVSHIQIDQAQTGILVGGRSIQITNVLIYVANIGIATINSGDLGKYLNDTTTTIGCSDITFSDIQIFATKFYSIQFRASGTFDIGALGEDVVIPIKHSNIFFNNVVCQQNIYSYGGWENFVGFVLIQSNEARNVVFNNCSFNNMNGPAINHQLGISNEFRFNNCTFDGRKTVDDYNQALTPYACKNLNDRMEFNNCTFKNLRDLNNNVTLTADGSYVGWWDSYSARINTDSGKILFDAGIHTITWTGNPEHTAIFTNASVSLTETIIRGCTVTNCLTPTATEPFFARISTGDSDSGVSSITEEDVLYSDQSMTLCNLPTVKNWFVQSDRYFPLIGVGAVPDFVKVGGRRSKYKVDTTNDLATISLPRTDNLNRFRPKNGDVITFVDAKNTWATNPVTFLAADNTIDNGFGNFIVDIDGAEVYFIYESDPDLAAVVPRGNWISRIIRKTTPPSQLDFGRTSEYPLTSYDYGLITEVVTRAIDYGSV